MFIRRLILLQLLIIAPVAATSLGAQSVPRAGPVAVRAWQVPLRPPNSLFDRSQRWDAFPRQPALEVGASDYRWEGVVIGGVTLGAGTAWLVSGFCSLSENGGGSCLARWLVGALVGATAGVVVGGMVGSLFRKGSP